MTLAGYLAAAALALAPAVAPSPATPPATASTPVAGTAELNAVAGELARAVDSLRLPDSPTPYRAEARWVRADLLSLDGSYGGVITDVLERQTAGIVELRVGTPQRDNTNFFTDESGTARFAVSLTPAAGFSRKQLWLALDQAFRGATRAFAQKKTTLERLQAQEVPEDLSAAAAPIDRRVPVTQAVFPRGELAALVGSLSARFEAAPSIDNGDVHVQVLRSHESVVSTDGVRLQRVRERAVLAVVADTRAEDGMHLDHGLVIHFDHIPQADEELLDEGEALVDRVLAELAEQAAAPMIEEEYDGPILLSPTAAAQLIASTVATAASGQPPPWADNGPVVDLEPSWQDKLGKNVLPPFIDLVDDPTSGFGAFDVDAQGFTPARLPLVEQGRLTNLLMTRTPNAKLAGSNGRARMTPGLEVGPAISNLQLVSRRRGSSQATLERELLRRAAEDGYEFAYVIDSLRDGTVLGPVPRESAAAYAGTGKLNLPIPGRVFRIEPGGKRTLVRGAVLGPTSMRTLRRIRAVGNDAAALPMRIAIGAFGGFASEVGIDAILAQTVDVQIETPSLLVDGLELLVERGEHERQRTLVHPLRRSPAADEAAADEAVSKPATASPG